LQGVAPHPTKTFLKKKVLEPKNFIILVWCTHRLGGTVYLLPHRLGALRLPTKTIPYLTRASTARYGIIFIACPADNGVGETVCSNAVGAGLAPPVQTLIANEI